MKFRIITAFFTALFLVTIATPVTSQNTEQLFQKGIMKEEGEGNLPEAIEIFNSIVEDSNAEHALQAKALLHVGLCYEKLGQNQTQEIYSEVVNKYPQQTEEVALAKERLNYLNAQLASLKKQAEQHLKKGNKLFSLWEYESAIEEYQKAMELTPNSLLALNAQYCIGQSWFRAGNYDLALETFKKLIDENPESNIAPVTELMITQVEQEMKEKENSVNVPYSADANTIVSEQGIAFRKYKSFVGKNDRITYATGGFNMSPDCRFLVLEKTVVPVDGSEPFQLVEKDALRANYDPTMTKAAFYADSAIWMIPVSPKTGHATGKPKKLIGGYYRYQYGPEWSPDGKKLVFARFDDEFFRDIWTINVNNGNLKPLVVSQKKEGHPVWAPNGKKIIYKKENDLWITSANGNDSEIIIKDGGHPFFSSDSKWLFQSKWDNCNLFSFEHNKNYKLEIPKQIGKFASFSPDDKKMYFYKPSYDDKWGIKIVSASGGPSFSPASTDAIYGSQWSLDSKYIFAQSEDQNGNIVCKAIPLNGGHSFAIDVNWSGDEAPFYFTISPYQKQLAFSVKKTNEKKDLYIVPFSMEERKAISSPRLIFNDWTGGAYNVTFSWSPDGDKIALIHNDDIWIVPLTGAPPKQLTNTPESERWISWSPDGKMLSYHIVSGQTGIIYTIPASGGDPVKIAKVDGPTTTWSPNSKCITIISNHILKIASIDGEDIKSINIPKEFGTNLAHHVEYSPDGKHFAWINYNGDESYIVTYSFEDEEFTQLASEVLLDYKYGLKWSPDGKWISYLTEENEKVRPEGVLWEADFEEVKKKVVNSQ